MTKPICITVHMALEQVTPVRMPGDVLQQDFLSLWGVSAAQLARRSGLPVRRINTILRGDRAITADIAIRLAATLGTSAFYWLALEARWSLDRERSPYSHS